MKKIVSETKQDKTLRKLRKYIRKGNIPKSKLDLHIFRKIQDQITLSNGLVLKQSKIILPESLWGLAIDKAHQGGHPGINILKRRVRSHFWIPGLNKLAAEKVKKCKMCQQFTSPGIKQPQKIIAPPESAWQEVSIDLFGPMPDHKHVVVVQDIKTRFPDAKIIPSTSAQHVIPAIAETYKQFGRPDAHRTDNGPPFNSQEFRNYSESQGIEHKKTYPYHPQANPVETFMKPLGKAMKIAHGEGKNKNTALNNLLMGFRSTPHVATGQTPGDLMFRGGYQQAFPRKILTPQEIEESENLDQYLKECRQNTVNSSRKRNQVHLNVGDIVWVRNNNRKKFEPMFGPEEYQITRLFDDGVELSRIKDKKTFMRHKNDVKPINHATENSYTHMGRWWEWRNDSISDDPEYRGAREEMILSDNQHIVQENSETSPKTRIRVPRALSRLADHNNPGISEQQNATSF